MSSPSRIRRRLIGEILVDEGLVTRDQVEEALSIQERTGENLGTILIDMDVITETDITKTIVVQYQLPFVRLENYQFDEKLVELFPAEFLHKHSIFPFDKVGKMLLCAVSELPREEVLNEIPRITSHNVALYAGSRVEVQHFLGQLCPIEKRETPKKKSAGSSVARKKRRKRTTEDAAARKIFEQSSEDLLQALDSNWDNIFEMGEDDTGEH